MSASDSAESAPQSRPAEADPPVVECESPPPAAQPPRDDVSNDPRARLLLLAAELARSRNRQLLAEFLRLRRAV